MKTAFKTKFDRLADEFRAQCPEGFLIIADNGKETCMQYSLSDDRLVPIFQNYIKNVEANRRRNN